MGEQGILPTVKPEWWHMPWSLRVDITAGRKAALVDDTGNGILQ